jgi:dTMP kinase
LTGPREAKKPPGLFFAFEGLDGSGKSTQAKLLAESLESRFNEKPLLLREPTLGPIGQSLREKLFGGSGEVSPENELSLFMMDRDWDVFANILPGLSSGQNVIIDRYVLSTVAYQGARGFMDPKEILRLNDKYPKPNLTFILDLGPEAALGRIKARGPLVTNYENLDFLVKVKGIYDSFDGPDILHVDAQSDPNSIHGQISRAADDLIRGRERTIQNP